MSLNYKGIWGLSRREADKQAQLCGKGQEYSDACALVDFLERTIPDGGEWLTAGRRLKAFVATKTPNAALIGRMRPDQGRCYQQEE